MSGQRVLEGVFINLLFAPFLLRPLHETQQISKTTDYQ
jgi:hypothetical protein